MKVSDLMAEYLKSIGVKYVFGYQGGSITHLIDSFSRCDGIEYIQNYHEQGAAFSADAYGRLCDEGIGVAVGTNGPGATNLVTGIANAYCDSVPVLFLTGQVHTWAMKGNAEYRQNSFQEIDIVSVARPITKYCVTVVDAHDAIPLIIKAVRVAKEGRKGPVLVDIPVDIQGEDIDYSLNDFIYHSRDCSVFNRQKVKEWADIVARMLKRSKAPVFLCGGCSKGAGSRVEKMAQKYRIPIVCSLMGLDRVNHYSEQFLGYIGVYGNRYANIVVQDCDILIVFGSRLDQRQTGKNVEVFAKNAMVVHIDIDEIELGHSVNEELGIHSDCEVFLEEFEDILGKYCLYFDEWSKKCCSIKIKYPIENEKTERGLNPVKFFQTLGMVLPENTVVCADVGQNQMWLAQALRVKNSGFRLLNSGGLGAMGYALPASIGAYYASNWNKCVAVMGDGGLQMNIQEMNTIATLQLPIIIIVINNHSLGMIRDIQEKYYSGNFEGTVNGFNPAPLEGISKAYGMNYIKLYYDVGEMYLKRIIDSNISTVVEIDIPQKSYLVPELIGMNSLDNQSPPK